jgi:hypothetical protein
MRNLFHLLQLAKEPGMHMYDFGSERYSGDESVWVNGANL